MPDQTPEERAYAAIEKRLHENHKDKKGNLKDEPLTGLELKVLTDVKAKFDEPGTATKEAIRDVINKDVEDAISTGSLNDLDKVAKKPGFRIGGMNIRPTILRDISQTVGQATGLAKNVSLEHANKVRGEINAQELSNLAEAELKAKPGISLGTLGDAPTAPATPEATLGALIKTAALADGNTELSSKEITDLAKSDVFKKTARTLGLKTDVDVQNDNKHDNDSVNVGGAKGVKVNLSDLGVTITDDAATGFKPGVTSITAGKGR